MKKITKAVGAMALAVGLTLGFSVPAEAVSMSTSKTCPWNQRAGVRVYNNANSYTGINVYSPVVGGPFKTSFGHTARSFSYLSGYREARFTVMSNSLSSVVPYCGP